MRTDIFGLNGYAGCVDEQGYVYRVSRNQALSNDACIGKIDSNGNVYRQSKHDLTSNSNIVGTWSGDGSIYVVGDSMLRGANYIGAYDSRGYVYLNAKNEVNSSENQAGFVQGNIPYGAAALLLLLMPAYEENSQSNRKKSSRGNKTRGQQRRMNQDASNLKYPKETYLAYGIGIAILIFIGYCLAKIAKAILYAATSVSFIATVIFLVFGWKLQKQVILGRQNKRLSDNDKRIIWQWVILCAVIVAMIGAVQDVINSSYIGSNIIWIIIGLSAYYLFFSAQYKLGKFDVSPIEFVTGKRDFSNQGQDRSVKSKQTSKPKRKSNLNNNRSKSNSSNRSASNSNSKSNSEYILLQCNECGQKSRIPANRGMLLVTCPRCGNTCEVES